ncbi:MAG: hypothetical protein R3330_01195, partial [Saprospiraceae bacterium]|nr:hypothetical protein [Saprospiraceae bacterium]
MRRALQYISLVALWTVSLSAQGQNTNDLYHELMQKGAQAMEIMTKDYQIANKYFKAAAISTKELQLQRQALMMADSADALYVQELKTAQKEAQDAYTRARMQQEAAVKAQRQAEASRRFSDALYLAFISDKEVQARISRLEKTHRDSLIMQLAHYGTLLTGDAYFRSIHGVFGRAVYNATRTVLNERNASIARMSVADDGVLFYQGRDGVISSRSSFSDPGASINVGDFIQDFQVHPNGTLLVVKRNANTVTVYE